MIIHELKPLTIARAKKLEYGDIVYQKGEFNSDGTVKRWKVTGKVKTWKRDKNRIKIPIRYGLYVNDYITEDTINLISI